MGMPRGELYFLWVVGLALSLPDRVFYRDGWLVRNVAFVSRRPGHGAEYLAKRQLGGAFVWPTNVVRQLLGVAAQGGVGF